MQSVYSAQSFYPAQSVCPTHEFSFHPSAHVAESSSAGSRGGADLPDFSGFALSDAGITLDKLIGQGSYGTVYSAWDASAGEAVAVKCMLADSRAREEGKALVAVDNHPNVISCRNVIQDGKYVFFVLDLAAGNLRRTASRGAFWRQDERVRSVWRQLAYAVHHCHHVGISHRDLKPDNILVNEEDDEVYLADFGLATTDRWSVQKFIGTLSYMSPELLGSFEGFHIATQPADVFALGVTFLQTLTGTIPWKRAILKDDVFREFTEDEHYLRRRFAISAGANALLRRMLAHRPEERPTPADVYWDVADIDRFFPSEEQFDYVRAARLALPRPKSAPAGKFEGTLDDLFASETDSDAYSIASGDLDSDELEDSEGPETPEMCADKLVADVEVLALDDAPRSAEVLAPALDGAKPARIEPARAKSLS